jgi:hypothetical protein
MKPSLLNVLLVAIIAVPLLTALGAAQSSGVHEYKIIEAQVGGAEKALNALGRDGWSLVAVTPTQSDVAA